MKDRSIDSPSNVSQRSWWRAIFGVLALLHEPVVYGVYKLQLELRLIVSKTKKRRVVLEQVLWTGVSHRRRNVLGNRRVPVLGVPFVD